MTVKEQMKLIREVMENEHGGLIYDPVKDEYDPIDWEAIELSITKANVGLLRMALFDCIEQMEQCERMFKDDGDFIYALDEARRIWEEEKHE